MSQTFTDSKVYRHVSVTGTLAVAAGAVKFVVPAPSDLVAVYVNVGTAPVGASILVDVNKALAATPNTFATVFPTQANRPTITTGTTSGSRVQDKTPVDLVAAPAQANFTTGYYDDIANTSDTVQTTGGIDEYLVTSPNLAPLASFATGDRFSVDVDQVGAATTEGADLAVTLVFDPK
jgi:hypothetical protein